MKKNEHSVTLETDDLRGGIPTRAAHDRINNSSASFQLGVATSNLETERKALDKDAELVQMQKFRAELMMDDVKKMQSDVLIKFMELQTTMQNLGQAMPIGVGAPQMGAIPMPPQIGPPAGMGMAMPAEVGSPMGGGMPLGGADPMMTGGMPMGDPMGQPATASPMMLG